MKGKTAILEGSRAVAEAVCACRPEVISVYPITPQTHILENLARFVASGRLKSQFVRADSEFSAASVVYGASATGARAYTASASQGILLMTEVIYAMASTRLPVVMTVVNRTVSHPITIQPDHQDSMSLRDTGALQIHVESLQEAYDAHVQAFRISEDPEVQLPLLVCMDGWVISHSYEPVTIFPEEAVSEFAGTFKPVQKLDPDKPLTYGSYADQDVLMEYRYALMRAQDRAKEKIRSVAAEYREVFGHFDGDLIDTYCTEDAEMVLIAMGSLVSTIRAAIDELRAEGRKVGLVKVRTFRPFPKEELLEACGKVPLVAVLDKSLSVNMGGVLATEVKSAFYGSPNQPIIVPFMAGLGGKDVNRRIIKEIVDIACRKAEQGYRERETVWMGLNYEFFGTEVK
ncbi:transketolase C-terminal domain-containing protein [Acetomicrobium sp. S15 = DSM 107314]|uniref:transketolase C-terminal domain-containing protein n=1 Tax=Acetomicrobium sp. S15 = DSM 107314 TaxID=2529858 RepID=UPI0018E14EAD|nr:transketolase C-terminal domain-containing protein [Acetomicrobium sp. S15 = DSM 107314]